jgi:hypothetical protein
MPWGVANYNTNPALNTSINGIDIAELSSAAGFNDALRQIMADIKAWSDAYAVTLPISIANGGTGQTSAAPALLALGGLEAMYIHLPPAIRNAAFDMDTSFDGHHIHYTGAAAIFTVTRNAVINMPIGCTFLIVNDGTGALSVNRDTGVSLIWASNGLDANRTLAVHGMATMIQVDTNRWFISGAGLS